MQSTDIVSDSCSHIISDTPVGDKLDKLCPYFMLMGMSYDEFWHGNICKWKYIVESYQLRRKYDNEMLWLQGLYNYSAFSTVLANVSSKRGSAPIRYLEEPIRITPMTEEEREAEKQKRIKLFRDAINQLDQQMRTKYGLDKVNKETPK